jgi:hypothetical protein
MCIVGALEAQTFVFTKHPAALRLVTVPLRGVSGVTPKMQDREVLTRELVLELDFMHSRQRERQIRALESDQDERVLNGSLMSHATGQTGSLVRPDFSSLRTARILTCFRRVSK